MKISEEILLDQEIICKALTILGMVCEEPNEFMSKGEFERLPKLKEKEYKKLAMLERQLKI